MSRDIVDTSTPSDRLVVATWIESESADQLTCVEVEDPNVEIGHEELDRPPLVSPAEANVMQPAVVAKGDEATLIAELILDTRFAIPLQLSSIRGRRPDVRRSDPLPHRCRESTGDWS
jgi:hypothetical protein